jgi:hypothetical protein
MGCGVHQPRRLWLSFIVMLAYSLSVFFAGYAAIDVWLTMLSSPDQCSVSLRTMSSEPSGMFDETEAEFDLVHLAASNQTSALVLFNGVLAEARIGDDWVEAPPPAPLSAIWPFRETEELVLMPKRADAYRLGFDYAFSLAPTEERLSDWVSREFPSIYGPHLIGRWLTYRWYEIRLGSQYQQYQRFLRKFRHWREGETSELLLEK